MERYTRSTAFRLDERDKAQEVYAQIQAIIFQHEEADLSCFRILGPTWIVAVIGEIPPEHIDRPIIELLNKGVRITIHEEVEKFLYARRAKEGKNGSWVERHIKF